MNKRVFKGLVGATLLLAVLGASANQDPKPLLTDPHMQTVAYDPNDVVTVVVGQLTQLSIQFSESETIVDVDVGNSVGWMNHVNKSKPNILFIKPTVDMPMTNLTVVTDKNIYHFKLMVPEKGSSQVPAYNLKFVYPQEEQAAFAAQAQVKKEKRDSVVTDHPVNPMNVNWNYSFSEKCSKDFAPIKAFDDGKFTYFQFANNTEIPAIFIVNQKGQESLANWSMRGKYIVIQRIARQFSMRNGKVVSCVFNDAYKA